jgi:hypothetical protein
MNEKYTIAIRPVGDHLEVTVSELPELGIIETAPDKVKRDDAVDLALARISEYQLEHNERSQARSS